MNSAPRTGPTDTCIGKECPIYKKLKLKNLEECPNFLETKYENEAQSHWIKDCAPKRALMLEQIGFNNINALRKSVSELTNQIKGLNEIFLWVMNQAQKKISN